MQTPTQATPGGGYTHHQLQTENDVKQKNNSATLLAATNSKVEDTPPTERSEQLTQAFEAMALSDKAPMSGGQRVNQMDINRRSQPASGGVLPYQSQTNQMPSSQHQY